MVGGGRSSVNVSPLEQSLRHAIVAYHARWSGRAPTTAQLVAAMAPATREEVEAALARLGELKVVLQREGGWHSRPPRMTSRAGDAMAMRSQIR